jgi:hypothetical protein
MMENKMIQKFAFDEAVIASTTPDEDATEIATDIDTNLKEDMEYETVSEEMSQQSNLQVSTHPAAPAATSVTAATSLPATTIENQTGIDIRRAIEILSLRIPHHHHSHGSHNASHHPTGSATEILSPGCCHDVEISNDLKSMGQAIDLFASVATPSSSLTPSEIYTQEQQQQIIMNQVQQQQKEKSEQHKAELMASLKTMTKISDLLQVLLRAQEDRVNTYRTYNSALQQVLNTRNITFYPPACAVATASFSMLSDTIRAVGEEMSFRTTSSTNGSNDENSNHLKQYVQWTKDLQQLEKEKLQLTAALHLEKIRANNENNKSEQQHNNEEAVLRLLECGIADLQQKIEGCITKINVVLEDLRCALVDELEKDEEA